MHTGISDRRRAQLAEQVDRTVHETPVFDIHTHLYDPAFGPLLLYGIDDLLTYHYLVAEVFRYSSLPYADFWRLPKKEQADHIWEHLFVRHSPISEACRGVLTTLQSFGLEVGPRELPRIRQWYAEQTPEAFVNLCFETANLRQVCMTNSPFDPLERPLWEKGFTRDERFVGGLRIDPVLLDWPNVVPQLQDDDDAIQSELNQETFDGIRRFLEKWTQILKAHYLMVSLPPSFQYPDKGPITQILDHAVLPHCREHHLPLALMIGVKRAVNPALQLAGEGMGRSDLQALESLCQAHPSNSFLCTVLARENQHELCVIARKFPNLHVFGCWWFTNIPELINEMTRLRLELLGLSVTPQHSDARVLDQVIYKWRHSRQIIASVLTEKYVDLEGTGWTVSQEEIQRDVQSLLGGEFERFCNQTGFP